MRFLFSLDKILRGTVNKLMKAITTLGHRTQWFWKVMSPIEHMPTFKHMYIPWNVQFILWDKSNSRKWTKSKLKPYTSDLYQDIFPLPLLMIKYLKIFYTISKMSIALWRHKTRPIPLDSCKTGKKIYLYGMCLWVWRSLYFLARPKSIM